ncbi:hypothetical protein HAX54_013270 [Datura stramonium]|uniref:HMG box domain-containing protein n=1 Tax=Datura stramonium TaxID=4076 RepID=A0ABS8TL31_DATST|nr:hypothetical protein [Datura stramonium]
MEPIFLSDSEEERVGPSGGSKDGGNPCYSACIHSPDQATMKLGRIPLFVCLSGSFSQLGGFIMKVGKSGAKADNMLGVKKKAPETKEAKKNVKMELVELLDSEEESFDPLRGSKDGGNPCEDRSPVKDPNKPKRSASSFFVFMEEFRKQFEEEHPYNKSAAAVGIAGGDKWKQLSDAGKAPYVEETEKRKVVYLKVRDAYTSV